MLTQATPTNNDTKMGFVRVAATDRGFYYCGKPRRLFAVVMSSEDSYSFQQRVAAAACLASDRRRPFSAAASARNNGEEPFYGSPRPRTRTFHRRNNDDDNTTNNNKSDSKDDQQHSFNDCFSPSDHPSQQTAFLSSSSSFSLPQRIHLFVSNSRGSHWMILRGPTLSRQ